MLIRLLPYMGCIAVVIALLGIGYINGEERAKSTCDADKAKAVQSTIKTVRKKNEIRNNINSLKSDALEQRMLPWYRD